MTTVQIIVLALVALAMLVGFITTYPDDGEDRM